MKTGSQNYLNRDCCRQNKNDIPIKDDTVAEIWAKNIKSENNMGCMFCKVHMWKGPVVKDNHVLIKRRINVVFVFDLNGECKLIKNKTLYLWWPKKHVVGCRFCFQKDATKSTFLLTIMFCFLIEFAFTVQVKHKYYINSWLHFVFYEISTHVLCKECSLGPTSPFSWPSCRWSQLEFATSTGSYLSASSPHSGDWLYALPITSCGLRLDDEAVRVAVGLRLGSSLCVPHQR